MKHRAALALALSAARCAVGAQPQDELPDAALEDRPAPDAPAFDAAPSRDGPTLDLAAADIRLPDDRAQGPSDVAPPPAPRCDLDAAGFARLAADLDRWRAARNVPGMGLAAFCGDRVFATGLGVVRAGGEAVTADTRFQLASVTKSLTAAVAVLLSARGALDLEAGADRCAPGVNLRLPYDRAATVAELLSHRAGYPTLFDRTAGGDGTLEGFHRANGAALLWSPPGALFNYSNLGYGVAGVCLQRAAGTPFAALVQSRLFAPLGMSGATLDPGRLAREGRFAYGHEGSGAPLAPSDSYYGAETYAPMGGAWASARDLAAFVQLLAGLRPDVMPPAQRATLTRSRGATGATDAQGYGLGVFVDPGAPGPMLSHGGSVEGFLTEYLVVPEAGFGALCLLNRTDGGLPSEVLQQAAFAHTGWVPSAPPPAPPAGSCVGRYRDAVRLGRVEVRARGAGLEAVFSDRGRTVPLSGDCGSFETTDPVDGSPTYGHFVYDAAGAARWMVTLSGVAARE